MLSPLYYLFPAQGQANCPNDNRPNRIQNHSGRGGLSFGNGQSEEVEECDGDNVTNYSYNNQWIVSHLIKTINCVWIFGKGQGIVFELRFGCQTLAHTHLIWKISITYPLIDKSHWELVPQHRHKMLEEEWCNKMEPKELKALLHQKILPIQQP